MHFSTAALSVLFATSSTVGAREVPANVRSFYNKVKAQDRCPNELQGGFHSEENDNKGMPLPPPKPLFPRESAVSCNMYVVSIWVLQRFCIRRTLFARQRKTTRQHGHRLRRPTGRRW